MKSLQRILASALVLTLSACQSYREAFTQVALESEIERLGFTTTAIAPNFAPGSIVATTLDPKKGDFVLVCSWNQVLSGAPDSSPIVANARLREGLLRQYGKLDLTSGVPEEVASQSVRVRSINTLGIALAAITEQLDTGCESAIRHAANRENTMYVVVAALRAELAYTFTPKQKGDTPTVMKYLGSFRSSDTAELLVTDDAVEVFQRIQLGIRVSPLPGFPQRTAHVAEQESKT